MDIDKEVFDRNLLLTRAYCELQLQKAFTSNWEVLRTFNPEYNGEPLFPEKTGKYPKKFWNRDPLDHYYLYNDLYSKLLIYKSENVDPSVVVLYPGKVIVAEIDEVLPDGASEAESDGFIDSNDCPPIDTWFYMNADKFGRVLFCWIPDKYVELVDNAIAVNTLEVFNWYDGDIDALIEKRKQRNKWRIPKLHEQTGNRKINNVLNWWGHLIRRLFP